MARPKNFEVADFGGEPQGSGFFTEAIVNWAEPVEWDATCPVTEDESTGYLYAIGHKRIEYVGLTTIGKYRFTEKHHAAEALKARGLPLNFCKGEVSFSGYKSRLASGVYRKNALEQLEHILIWAIPNLHNDKKQNSLPLLQSSDIANATAWHITNTGFKFHGEMPKRIVYPWMLFEPMS